MKLCLALMVLNMLGASGAFGQDAPGPSKESGPVAAPQATATEKPQRVRIAGNVTAAKITHMVQPAYPQAAKDAHISGTVVLHCIVAKDGTMSQVEYVSGPPLLIKAAMDAVRQWTYQPTKLNGTPIEVDTTVSVVFQLGKKSAGDTPLDPAGPGPKASAATASAASTETAAPVPIDPQLKADIFHLMDVTHFKEKQDEGMRAIFDTLRPTLLATIPTTPNREKILDAYIDKLVALLQSGDFTNAITALYAKYLTDADIKAASAFYETTAGQHYLESAQKLIPETMAVGQRIAAENIPGILKDLCQEYPELQGEAKFCAVDPTKKSMSPGEHAPAGN
jgi:TonB family protein